MIHQHTELKPPKSVIKTAVRDQNLSPFILIVSMYGNDKTVILAGKNYFFLLL